MYVPIVASLPGGNGSATITRFAWFYVTGTSGGGSRLVINGQRFESVRGLFVAQSCGFPG